MGDPILDRGSVVPLVELADPPQFRVCRTPEHPRQMLRAAHHPITSPGPRAWAAKEARSDRAGRNPASWGGWVMTASTVPASTL